MPLDSWSDSPDILTLSGFGRFLETNVAKEQTNVDAGFPSQLNKFGQFVEVAPSTSQSSPVGVTTTYRLRGYYVAGTAYEFWTGTSTTTPNPSGNPLVGVVIDAVIS